MNIVKRISGLFSSVEEEAVSFRLLFLQSLFTGFANSYYYIVANTFLLKKVAIKYLPTAYIVTGIGGYLLIQLYKTVQKKYGIPSSLRISLLLFTVICLLNFVAIPQLSGNAVLSVYLAYFMVSFAPPFTAIFSLGIFAQCSRLFNIAQSKRLLALVVSGEIFASVIAFLTISFSGGLIKGHEYYLLPIAALFTLLVFIPFGRLLKLKGSRISQIIAAKGARKVDFSFLTKDRFFFLIAIVTLFSVFAVYVIDYAYLVSVRFMANITALEIAQIAAVFLFVVKISELAFSFLSGKILSEKGVRFSVLLLPVILLLFCTLAFVSGFGDQPIFLLAFLFMGKLTDRAVRKSVTMPSIKVMYHVAEPHERLDIETTIDGLLSQVAIIISGAILLVISITSPANDPVALLRLFSLVCIIAFSLWAFFTFRMYENYRGKIREFLSRLKAGRGTSHTTNGAAHASHEHKATLNEHVDQAMRALKVQSKEELLQLVKVYNPRHFIDAATTEDKMTRRLSHIYYNNNFYFSRLLIVRYLAWCDPKHALNFLKDLWDVSDITCKLELMIAFNELNSPRTDAAFFERQCQECAAEITWTDAAIVDTAVLNDAELEKELRQHRSLLVRLLCEVLKQLYEPSIIQTVADMVTHTEELENQLFAIELLDVTLQPEIKDMVKLVLEPLSFDSKTQKLGKLFHVYSLPAPDRLKDIMMRDYNLVNLKLKEAALVAYKRAEGDNSVLSAFRTHSKDNLRHKADEFYSGFRSPEYQAKKLALKQIEDSYRETECYTPYLFNYALSGTKRKSQENTGRFTGTQDFLYDIDAEGTFLRLDTLAVALILTLRHSRDLEAKHEVMLNELNPTG